MDDQIEFYEGGKCIAVVKSRYSPDRGDLVNIRQETYCVVGRSYTLDYADDARNRQMTCVINLEKPNETE